MQAHTDAIGDFFHRIRGSRRPAIPTPPPPAAEPISKPPAATPGKKTRVSSKRAREAEHKHRNRLEAEKLMAGFIRDLRPGDHVYRCLKDAFDAACEDCGLDPISDHLAGKWLRRSGLKRFAAHRDNITMYATAPRRSSPRLVAA